MIPGGPVPQCDVAIGMIKVLLDDVLSMCCFLSSRAYNTYDRVSVGTTTLFADPPIMAPRPSG
jgi:hypothetical protein